MQTCVRHLSTDGRAFIHATGTADNENMAEHPHLPHVSWRGLVNRAMPALALGWAAGSQFDPRVATAFLELRKYAPTPAEDESPKQRARPIGARRPRRNGASTKPAP